MTKIKKIGRQETKLLVNESLTVLQKAMNKYGIEVGQANGARYGGDTMTVKIEFKVPALSEERAESDYRLYMDSYSIKAPYGFEFQAKGDTYKVTGINHKAPKNRILLLNTSNGRKAHCPVQTINWEYTKSQDVKKVEAVVNG